MTAKPHDASNQMNACCGYKQSVIRAKAERTSSRSRTYFELKQNVIRVETERRNAGFMLPQRTFVDMGAGWRHFGKAALFRPIGWPFPYPEGIERLTGQGWQMSTEGRYGVLTVSTPAPDG